MKRFTKFFTGVLLILMLLLSFAACSSNNGIEGTYVPYSMEGTVMGVNISVVFENLTAEEKAYYGEFEQMKMEFTKNEVTVYTADLQQGERGKYRRDGNKIVPLDENGVEEPMNIDGMSTSLTVDGDKLLMAISMTDSGVSMNFTITFKKVK